MANYVAITGIIDQVGGNIKVPPSEIHIPRYQGNFFTIPIGLQILGGRKYVWSVDTTLPGVIGITNIYSPTPTIEFDFNAYSASFLPIRCTIIGQPNNFVEYILYTSATSTAKTSLYPITTVTNNNFYNVRNLNIFTDNSILFPDNGNYYLGWAASAHEIPQNYLVQIWQDGWSNLTVTNNTVIPITNPNTSYRVKAQFLNSEVQSEFKSYGIQYTDSYLLSSSSIKSLINISEYLLNFSQNLSGLTFFTAIENTIIETSIVFRVNSLLIIKNFNQNLSQNIFFSSVEELTGTSNVIAYINTYDHILNFNQNSSPNIFWVESIGT